ncbi:MAG: hypothetical protein A3C06_02765 [Candidatus Taylorbacteria bacterium RIFCSPHIGHO2_02_FULL_46_13]|uniref:DUF218 domain-containing protein n=1 Tax=Candidatus Taylorbacteria bacterium RIFCSPHIGHO2_02_FULL_46_13 TaxID=1802312 RepID=A0A1G2MRV7_9BACT|nr:MAG: hypothetical protein A3C06_02765 [Candidatus Taylorbacteria bacterium RIFCSPHIGHO2_02_FULL_46_13]
MNIELLELYEVTNMLLSCRPQKPVNAILMHARSFDGDDDGLFELVRKLIPSVAPIVVINGGGGEGMRGPSKKAWPGVEEYEKRLSSLGVMDIIRSAPARHTQEESEKFVDIIKERGWRRVVVANLPHYLLRSMLSGVCEIQKRGLSVLLYPVAPVSLSWRKPVFGSQGVSPIKRFAQCHEELKRITEYQKQYPDKFVSIKSLVEYLSVLPG